MEVTATALLCLNTSSRLSCKQKDKENGTEQLTFIAAVLNTDAAYLRLGEHVQAPGAHLAIGGNADQVVGVLGSNHAHTVDGVLSAIKHSQKHNTR